MWRYIGPFRDPHRLEYFPGMTRHAAGRSAELLDEVLDRNAEPGVAEVHRHIIDHSADVCSALVWRHDGAACGFICIDREGTATVDDLVSGARRAFPELFTHDKMPFAVIKAEPCPTPSPSAPSLSAASASSTSTKAPGSKPGKPSSKSSA